MLYILRIVRNDTCQQDLRLLTSQFVHTPSQLRVHKRSVMDGLCSQVPTTSTTDSHAPTYFDSLPYDALAHIAQVRPSFPFSDNSPLRAAATLLFNALYFKIGDQNDNTNYDVFDSTIRISARSVDSAVPRVERILSVCGCSVKKITVCRFFQRVEGEDCSPIVAIIAKYCPNVESLVLAPQYATFCSWIALVEKYATQLNSIIYSQLAREETPRFTACTNLLRLHCGLQRTDTLISVLQCIGQTLEEIRLYFTDDSKYEEAMYAIQSYCRRLTVILMEVHIYRDRQKIYTSLLCSYGSQLVSADVQNLTSENLRKITEACSNLRTEFAVDLQSGEDKWECIEAVGPALDFLEIENYPCVGDESLYAMARCGNLRRLRVADEENDFLSGLDMHCLFANAKFRVMEELTIEGLLPSKLNLQLIASSMSNLRELDFYITSPIESGEFFKPIVDANPHLNDVNMRECNIFDCQRSADAALEILAVLLQLFSKCTILDIYLRVKDGEQVDEKQLQHLCGYLPYRGLDLVVGISDSRFETPG